MCSTLAAKWGSLESLKLRPWWGRRPRVRQIRWTELTLSPLNDQPCVTVVIVKIELDGIRDIGSGAVFRDVPGASADQAERFAQVCAASRLRPLPQNNGDLTRTKCGQLDGQYKLATSAFWE